MSDIVQYIDLSTAYDNRYKIGIVVAVVALAVTILYLARLYYVYREVKESEKIIGEVNNYTWEYLLLALVISALLPLTGMPALAMLGGVALPVLALVMVYYEAYKFKQAGDMLSDMNAPQMATYVQPGMAPEMMASKTAKYPFVIPGNEKWVGQIGTNLWDLTIPQPPRV
jgi:hypothetical protein